MPREQKITLSEMRSGNGPTRLIVYCRDFKCAHSVVIDAGRWGDDVRLSDLEPKLHVSGLWPPWRRCQAAVRARENGNGWRLIAFKPRAGPPRRIGMTASAYPPAGAVSHLAAKRNVAKLCWRRSPSSIGARHGPGNPPAGRTRAVSYSDADARKNRRWGTAAASVKNGVAPLRGGSRQ